MTQWTNLYNIFFRLDVQLDTDSRQRLNGRNIPPDKMRFDILYGSRLGVLYHFSFEVILVYLWHILDFSRKNGVFCSHMSTCNALEKSKWELYIDTQILCFFYAFYHCSAGDLLGTYLLSDILRGLEKKQRYLIFCHGRLHTEVLVPNSHQICS